MVSGRKIDPEYENPFDNVFIDIASWLNRKIFKPLRFDPNMITTLSLIIVLLVPWTISMHEYLAAAILFIMAYILDCADGNFARRYNMITTFGDYYDHVCDLIKIAAVLLAIALHPLSILTKIVFFSMLLLLKFGTGMHIGCQEKMYNPTSTDSLAFTKVLCPNKENIVYTRYVGMGTVMVFIASFIVYIGLINTHNIF